MSTINIEVTKNVYDVDLQQNVTSYDVKLEKGYYPLPSEIDLSKFYTKDETYSKIEIDSLLNVIEVTKTELDVLISENKLEPNRLYKIRGVESWCFSQHLIKAIYLKAITNNTLEIEGVGEFYTPKYNTSDSNLGIWKGELFANEMIDSLSYNVGDKVIWGNLFWENISGSIGTNEKEYYDEVQEDSYFLKLQSWISETDWQLITPNDDESLYNIQFNLIKYDFENDYINYREDNLGNVYELPYNVLLELNIENLTDPTFIYYLNGISLFQWSNDSFQNNKISHSCVINCNYKHVFKSNVIIEKSIINDNNFFNIDFIGNIFKKSRVIRNYLKTYGGILYNTLDSSSISSNKYYIEISYNNLKTFSVIYNNNDNNIIVNNKYTIIRDNILDNNSTISNNTFVEEGKAVDPTIKSIHGNELINNCSINNNTIKNGSRIMNHNLSYFSTINGNTLDTDSNIYNNQLIQYGKINNNILTGHSRIFNNQLDNYSEITLCKLRISPTTSHSSGINGNRLFLGKIQNVDFGNIVNPEGTNPNDPNFSGNALSLCIIENGSIIQDLTFPNTGGKFIQFVKMNGYSEFKNITVNDSIRNVDFINTIFNETSDYSKLIEGSGYKTNGFTKTYIDGILLQDKLDEKQDVLTEDNIGQFMDVKLSTKSTPTSGDTVLGRDSVTGKAVEIPTSSLGGNGGGSGLALGETSETAYRGDRGKIAFDHSQTIGNPHGTTKADIGLGNVNNTSDVDKPISTATQSALNAKADLTLVNNLQIGGRNLIRNSKTKPAYQGSGSSVQLTNGFKVINSNTYNFFGNISLEVGQQYTFSIKIRKLTSTNGYIQYYLNGNNHYISFVNASEITDTFKVFSHTRTITVNGECELYIIFPDGELEIEYLKLEKGNKTTDWTPAPEDKQDRLQDVTGNIGVGKPDASATEKLEVGGNIKATQFKDENGTLKSQRCITITGNTTLSEIHNGAVLNITNTCNITIPTGLDANFQCVIFAKGSIIVTFVNSGVAVYAPSGMLLKTDKMASLICTGVNNFNLTGELATS